MDRPKSKRVLLSARSSCQPTEHLDSGLFPLRNGHQKKSLNKVSPGLHLESSIGTDPGPDPPPPPRPPPAALSGRSSTWSLQSRWHEDCSEVENNSTGETFGEGDSEAGGESRYRQNIIKTSSSHQQSRNSLRNRQRRNITLRQHHLLKSTFFGIKCVITLALLAILARSGYLAD